MKASRVRDVSFRVSFSLKALFGRGPSLAEGECHPAGSAEQPASLPLKPDGCPSAVLTSLSGGKLAAPLAPLDSVARDALCAGLSLLFVQCLSSLTVFHRGGNNFEMSLTPK